MPFSCLDIYSEFIIVVIFMIVHGIPILIGTRREKGKSNTTENGFITRLKLSWYVVQVTAKNDCQKNTTIAK